MTPHRQEASLSHVPWGAVGGELVTALCFGCLGLFLPIGHWVTWPDLLFNWHVAVIVVGALALAAVLAQRRPASLKAAIALAAYTGLPSLLTLWQAIGGVHSSAEWLGYVVFGVGMLGQAAVLWSCLTRLAPPQKA